MDIECKDGYPGTDDDFDVFDAEENYKKVRERKRKLKEEAQKL